jgi:hypothetical protein
VLLSFAQFEREVIGERVRDKIAASKRKGPWSADPPRRKKPINRAVSLSVSLWTLGPKPTQFRAGFGVIFGGRGAELLPGRAWRCNWPASGDAVP